MQASSLNTSEAILIPKAFSFLRQPKRYKILYGGRGGAKSHNIARTLLILGMEKPLRIICAREIQKSIADSVHELLSDLILLYPQLTDFYKVTDKEITGVNGTQFKFRGLKHNTTDLKSLEGCDILWIEEAENVSHRSYEIVIPTIRKANSEIWISFNPKNPTDPTWQRFVLNKDEDTVVKKVSWRDNPFFPDVLEKERQRLLKSDPEAYQHVWEGEFDTRFSGAVYAKWLKQEQVSDMVEHDPDYPVYTAWDLGFDDATAIVFYQIGNGEIFIIDYYESNLEDTKHYCEVLYGKEIVVDERNLETGEVLSWHFGKDLDEHKHRQGYKYHPDFAHNVPHDAANKVLSAGGRSILDQARRFDVKMRVYPAVSQVDSQEALRMTLPRCWINSDKCNELTQALLNYHYEYDDDRQIYSKVPVHDWSSHACDAMEIMARAWRDKAVTQKEIDRNLLDRKFHRLRRENVLDNVDPYRVKPMRRK